MELRGQQALELPARLNLRLALALLALVLAAPAVAAAQTGPSYDADGNLIQTPFVPQGDEEARLTEEQAIATALADPKIAGWIARYKGEKFTKQATFKEAERVWQVKVWVPGKAGQIVEAKVEDATGLVKDPWTGPQVAWGMARGTKGAFGADLNEPYVWLAFCALFFVGLADWRRLLSVRNLDLLVLLSFSISLAFFNRGEIFRAMPLVYPPLLYLLGRLLWVTWRRRPTAVSRPVWPVWLLVAVTVLTIGVRIGLNVVDLEHDRRRLRERDRRAADRLARERCRTATCRSTRARSAGRRTRRATCASGSRRTAAASPRTAAATRTGR